MNGSAGAEGFETKKGLWTRVASSIKEWRIVQLKKDLEVLREIIPDARLQARENPNLDNDIHYDLLRFKRRRTLAKLGHLDPLRKHGW